ncbi:hypothetical protein O181_120350 [Austropuccinia psidii MF-1]|uniref:Retrotransposon gag domain-containing protein n=1 Tax=Austropuccinia psidii MF-1 TaxID=1389203 RepID=A0A9Q3KFM3_9BASI|nr:hypothetical protein [Austropuccinia psidii MF-1]
MIWKSFQEKRKVLYSNSIIICRAEKWIEPYLCNLTNKGPRYLLNYWKLFESQLFNLFGDPSEVRKAGSELDALRIKGGGHVSLYTTDFKSLVARIGDWGERALIHHFRKGVSSSILDHLSPHHSRVYSIQDLMDITLERYTRYCGTPFGVGLDKVVLEGEITGKLF